MKAGKSLIEGKDQIACKQLWRPDGRQHSNKQPYYYKAGIQIQ